ncbi:MAG: carbohydrate ABC transporter permease, partial [Calditrichaeota bacterium]|nr:carbohydrate ABC transporter permease [Calditrichota bacterium]
MNARLKKIKNRLLKTATYLFLVLLAGTMLLPFFWMLMTSFMNELEVYSPTPKFLPEHFLWSNYKEALTMLPFGRFFLNTLIISVAVVAGQLLICSMAAFSFSRLQYRGRDKIFTLYLSTLMIPGIVTLIPAYLIVDSFHWLNTYWALIVPFLSSVWGIFLLRQFFLTLPRELEDAARIDGAGTWTIYWRIILPLSKPALATLGIFSFMGMWKEFLWPLVVTNQMDMRPVEVGIALFHSIYSTNWPYQMAAAVVVMLPIVLLFFFTQRYFV